VPCNTSSASFEHRRVSSRALLDNSHRHLQMLRVVVSFMEQE
jgi:hypothetical protein